MIAIRRDAAEGGDYIATLGANIMMPCLKAPHCRRHIFFDSGRQGVVNIFPP